MAQPFDFGALLQNPAFMFGSTLLSNSRQPGAIGGAFGTVQKLQEMQQQKAMQQAQMENMRAERAAQQEQLGIARDQYNRQNSLTEQQLKQAQMQQNMQQQIMNAISQRMGIPMGAPATSDTTPAPGASGSSAEYNIAPGSQPSLTAPNSTLMPGGANVQPTPFNSGQTMPYQGALPNAPQGTNIDPAGPFQGGGRASQFGQPGANGRPMLKTRFGTPPQVLDSLAQVESSGGKNLVGPLLPSGERALGPYQFLPSTVSMLQQQGYPKFNVFDPQQARDAADFYLQQLQQQHGGSLPLALAAYGGHSNPMSPQAQTYVQKVLGPAGAASRDMSVQPPVMTPGQPDVGSRAVDIGQLGMLAGIGGLKGAQQIIDFAKMLQPQSVTGGTYQKDPATGKMTFIPNPYEEQRIGISQQQLANDQSRLGLEGQRVGLETAKTKATLEDQANKTDEKRNADVAAYQGASSSMDRMYKQADEILNHPGFKANTGAYAALHLNDIPGTPGYDTRQMLESLKSKLVVDTLTALKSAGKNGSSGFGQLSDKEGQRLETFVANLNGAQSEPALRKAIGDIKQFALESKGALADRLSQSYGPEAIRAPAPAAAPPTTGNVMSLDAYIAKHKK